MILQVNNSPAFTGIKPPYYKNERIVYPIMEDLTTSAMEIIEKLASKIENRAAKGNNGEVFHFGQDLVVKKHKGYSALISTENRLQETRALDLLYELEKKHFMSNFSNQRGIASFIGTDNNLYLISTKVEGAKPDVISNPYNRTNLKSLINTLSELDKGTPETGKLMHYDLNGNNIFITKDKASLIDFEYMRPISTETEVNWLISGNQCYNPHAADTIPVSSNIKTFEYSGLLYYLKNLFHIKGKEETLNFFKDYLSFKSEYHEKMSQHYDRSNLFYGNTMIKNAFIRKEKIHSDLLANPTDEIIEAELKKIQIANFSYELSPYDVKEKFLNFSDLIGFQHSCELSFKSKAEKYQMSNSPQDERLYEYFKDCFDNIRLNNLEKMIRFYKGPNTNNTSKHTPIFADFVLK